MRDLATIRAIAITISTTMFVAGCALLDSRSNSSPNSLTRSSDEGSSSIIKSPGSDPKGEIETVAKNFLAIESFRCRSTTSGMVLGVQPEPVRMNLDYVKPDRYRFQYGVDPEKIIIGKDVYVKKGEKWTKTTGDSESQIPGVRDGFSDEAMRRIDKVEYLGEEVQNGETLLQYSILGRSIGYQEPYEVKLWVFKQTDLPAKFVLDYHNDNHPIVEVDYSYPTDIQIDVPV